VLDYSLNFGLGGSGRLSFRLTESGWDFDLNVTCQQCLSRIITGETFYELIPSLSVSGTRNWVSR